MRKALEAFDLAVGITAWWGSSRSDRFMEVREQLDYGDDLAQVREYLGIMPEVYWVNRDMVDVIDAARATLEPMPRIEESPAQLGFVQFARVIDGPEEPVPANATWTEPYPDPIHAMSWVIAKGTMTYPDGRVTDTRLVTICTYSTPEQLTEREGSSLERHRAAMRMMNAPGVEPGPTYSLSLDDGVPPPERTAEMMGILRAFWLLSQQRIARVDRQRADRAARKRAARLTHQPLPDVAVVTLRRPAGRPREDTDGPGFVEWSHRWIVGGHWRNQFLPSEDRHEPRWIAPYIKGPEDKPLVTDRVYELTR